MKLNDFFSLDVVLDPALDAVPRMQVSPAFADNMPAAFVADLNAWMREFFGTEPRAVLMDGGIIAVGPRTLEAIKDSLS